MRERLDEDLVFEIQQGNILSFEILVRRYQNRVVNFVSRIVHNDETAREIAQDTFLKTYQAIDRIDRKRKFSTFLFEVAKNTAISRLRGTKQELPLSENIPVFENESNIEKIDREDEEKSVRGAVAKLPTTYRKTIGLYYFADLSYEEISRKLQLPINTVRTNLRRAKIKLKGLIKK